MCQISVGLAHHDDEIIHSTWLLIDAYSTSSVGKNPDMFKKISECLEEERLNVVKNGGNKAFNEIGEYGLFPIEAHFNLHTMAKMVALKDMTNVPGVRITMDSSKQHAIAVDYEGKNHKFKECQYGL